MLEEILIGYHGGIYLCLFDARLSEDSIWNIPSECLNWMIIGVKTLFASALLPMKWTQLPKLLAGAKGVKTIACIPLIVYLFWSQIPKNHQAHTD